MSENTFAYILQTFQDIRSLGRIQTSVATRLNYTLIESISYLQIHERLNCVSEWPEKFIKEPIVSVGVPSASGASTGIFQIFSICHSTYYCNLQYICILH